MTHQHARLIAVAIAAVSFSTPITAQQETVPQEVADIRIRGEQGDAEAQNNLGTMYSRGFGVPQGQDPDFAEAVRYFRLAADQAHAGGQYNLGSMYDAGAGVARDYVEAPLVPAGGRPGVH